MNLFDNFRYYGKYEFYYKDRTDTTNIRLKWMSICLSINYENGTMEAAMNGKMLTPIKKSMSLEWPSQYNESYVNVHMGRYFGDNVPIIGRMADINIWDR